MLVTKRNGNKEEFSIEKINKVVSWAVKGLKDVNISDIEIGIELNLTDGITTESIHSLLIDATTNLISEENPNYQYVAGRLLNFQIRKQVWGSKNPPTLKSLVETNVGLNYYSPKLLELYSDKDYEELQNYIDHDKDFNYSYASVKQLCDKYLVKNRKSNELYETPQFRYMVASMFAFQNYGKNRLEYVKKAYDYFSDFKINLATPQLSGLGTNHNSFSSCCLIEMDDTKESINATNHAVANATSAAYGIGVNFGRMRAIGSGIKNNTVIHPGVVPFLKITEANCKAWLKNGVRGGSSTVNFPIWHSEIETIVQLKNANTGTNDNRVFNLDYVIGISKLFYERYIKQESISLFSPSNVPGLYDSFGADKFDELYLKYEKDESIPKTTISSAKLFETLCTERIESGRIYILNVDNVNKYGCWLDPVYMTNLCVEVTQAINKIKAINDADSEIGVCILSACNWLAIESEEEHESVCDVMVRLLEEVIDIQEYFDLAAKNFATKKRSLGIGVTNLAAFLAYNKVKYSDGSALELVDEWMERQQYYLIKSSIALAKERGACEKFSTSKYSQDWLPIDKQFKFKLIDRKPALNWEKLRKDLKRYGMRHCSLTCQMPCESSSVVQGVTNGVEPVRSLITFKTSKKSSIPVIVPNIKTHREFYELAFSMKDNIGYLNVCNVMQRWMDMSMSVNQYLRRGDGVQKMMKELLHHYRFGGKSFYYSNTNDENVHFENCESGACAL